MQRERCLQSAGSRRELVEHCPEERLSHNPDNEPQQVAATAVAAPVVSVKSCTTEVTANCSTSPIQSETFSKNAEIEEKADAAQTSPTVFDRVLMLRPADQATVNCHLWHKAGADKLGVHNV